MTPALLTLAKRALTGEAKLARGAVLLAAVSGGPDSMALLHVLARLAPQLGIVVHAHGVDHGLRRRGGRASSTSPRRSPARLGVPFARTRLRVARGGNLQARARAARFEALAVAARAVGARAIATAHHADDRAETVLLRLMRGAGPRGLAVLPPRAPLAGHDERSSSCVRFVRARRAAMLAHLERHGDPLLRATRRTRILAIFAYACAVRSCRSSKSCRRGSSTTWSRSRISSPRDARPRARAAFPLSRSIQAALAELVRSSSTTARVWLPGGLVVTLDPRARPRARHAHANQTQDLHGYRAIDEQKRGGRRSSESGPRCRASDVVA